MRPDGRVTARRDEAGPGLSRRLFLIAFTAVAMGALILALPRWAPRGQTDAAAPGEREAPMSELPIAAEAEVFRLGPSDATVSPAGRRRSAHPRSLATARVLRAYPEAPPRVPHGLTSDEYRATTCATCHTRGGFSQRFGAYAPVTPHPEWTSCLQCHVPDDRAVGLPLPGDAADAVCRQCHARGARETSLPALTWQSARWPTLARPGFAPPPIPHDTPLRSHCVACHAGPGAIAEIRTDHPERADCRACHVAVVDLGEFVRPDTTHRPSAT